MPNKVWLHPIPWLIAFLPVIAGVMANYFGLGPAYTYPFAAAVMILTALNVTYGTSHTDWTIAIPQAWVNALRPAIAMLSGVMTSLIPALTGPGSPYHLSYTVVAILSAIVLVTNWIAQSIQAGIPAPEPAQPQKTAVPAPQPVVPSQPAASWRAQSTTSSGSSVTTIHYDHARGERAVGGFTPAPA